MIISFKLLKSLRVLNNSDFRSRINMLQENLSHWLMKVKTGLWFPSWNLVNTQSCKFPENMSQGMQMTYVLRYNLYFLTVLFAVQFRKLIISHSSPWEFRWYLTKCSWQIVDINYLCRTVPWDWSIRLIRTIPQGARPLFRNTRSKDPRVFTGCRQPEMNQPYQMMHFPWI